MSIHSILAVLMSSTALAGYSPLMVVSAYRFTLTGVVKGGIGPIYDRHHSISGPSPEFYVSFAQQHGLIGPAMDNFAVVNITQNIIFSFLGVAALVLQWHTILDDMSPEGYGANYGGSYGG